MNDGPESAGPEGYGLENERGDVSGFGPLAAVLASWREKVHRLPGGAAGWRVVVTGIGAVAVVAGVLMLVLPGPGWLMIFAGLGILSTEYVWAAKLLHRARRWARRGIDAARAGAARPGRKLFAAVTTMTAVLIVIAVGAVWWLNE